ncbi:hypothetical protein FKM82_002578 [Ascaphus truei]
MPLVSEEPATYSSSGNYGVKFGNKPFYNPAKQALGRRTEILYSPNILYKVDCFKFSDITYKAAFVHAQGVHRSQTQYRTTYQSGRHCS